MAYDIPNFRDDWLRQIGSYSVYPATIYTQSANESVALHDFVGAQSGYEGALTQHGEFCYRSFCEDDANSKQWMLRYFSAQQESDDAAPVEITGAFLGDYTGSVQYAGLMVKVDATGHAEGTVLCPAQADLSDGDNVVLSDGTTSVTFWVDKTGTYDPGYDATNVRWLVQSLTTAIEVTDALRTLVEAATNLNLTTDNPGVATVRVTNRDMDLGGVGGYVTNAAITSIGPFTVTGMAGGGNTISQPYGYYLYYEPTASGRLNLDRCYFNCNTEQGPYNSNTVDLLVPKTWIGLRLIAYRIDNSMRIKGYYMVGKDAVDAMYTNPQWIQAFDVLHFDGNTSAVAGSVVPGQVLGTLRDGNPSYTGKAGFGSNSVSSPANYFFSSMRITRGATL